MLRLRLMSAGDKTFERGVRTLRNKLWWLIAGRVAAIVLLFLLSKTLFSRGPSNSDKSVFLIFLTVIGLSIIYAIALRFARHRQLQAGSQLFFDALIITWLVWVTGDVGSPFAALYIVNISVASIMLGARAALIASVGCAVIFTGLSMSVLWGLVSSFATPETEISTLRVIQS